MEKHSTDVRECQVGLITDQASLNRAERTASGGRLAVSGRTGGSGGGALSDGPFDWAVGAGVLPPGARKQRPPKASGKRSTTARNARRWPWLKGDGGYLDIVPYYTFESFNTPLTEEPELRSTLEHCHHTWIKEKNGEKSRWRGIGCGRRDWCPLCGSYRQLKLSQEAAEAMLLAQTAIEVNGVGITSYGLKFVLTFPKAESERIDKLLWTNYQAWTREINRLFHLVYAFISDWFGEGVGGVVSLDYTGESNPSQAHYHFNVYLFPARIKKYQRKGGKRLASPRLIPVGHWLYSRQREQLVANWTARVNNHFKLRLASANLKASYLGNKAQLYHWQRYMYRSPLSDLWKGWQGLDIGGLYDPICVDYKPTKKDEVVKLSENDMQRITERVQLIPAHFKRVRWFGVFSDGQRADTMNALGLEADEVEDDDEGETWEEQGMARFVRFTSEGMILRKVIEREDGGRELGPEFFVPEEEIDYRPSKVAMGKRKRWREPGRLRNINFDDG
jgi:hypothetical protein